MQITVVELYQQSVETILFFVIVPEELLKITVDWSQIFHRNRNGIPSTFPSQYISKTRSNRFKGTATLFSFSPSSLLQYSPNVWLCFGGFICTSAAPSITIISIFCGIPRQTSAFWSLYIGCTVLLDKVDGYSLLWQPCLLQTVFSTIWVQHFMCNFPNSHVQVQCLVLV